MNKHGIYFPGQAHNLAVWGKNYLIQMKSKSTFLNRQMIFLDFGISDIMFNGTDEELKQTKVTQPGIFLHSVIAFKNFSDAKPDMVQGILLENFLRWLPIMF